MMTIQERLDSVTDARMRFTRATNRLCDALATEAAAPKEHQIDDLVTAIDACTATATTLAAPPVAKAKPAAKRPRRR